MCSSPGPDGRGAEVEGDQPSSAGRGTARSWRTRDVSSWWTGLRAVLLIGETVAVLKHHEALAQGARALIALGDMAVDAGKHERP